MSANSLPMSYARRYWGRFLHYDPLFLVTLLVFQTIAAVFYWRFTGWDTLDGGMSWMGEASMVLREGKFGQSVAPLTSVYFAICMWLLGETIIATKIALPVVFFFYHCNALYSPADDIGFSSGANLECAFGLLTASILPNHNCRL